MNKVGLIILDGWGIGKADHSDAVFTAQTPFADHLNQSQSKTTLRTDGENVGLPEGQMGNSEVGHTNIGAGRVVYQDLVRINKAIREASFFKEKALIDAFEYAQSQKKSVHLLGLLSDGGVHSHLDHLIALAKMAQEYKVPTFIHAIMDGRDTDPRSGLEYMTQLEDHIDGTSVQVATVIGRYFAMDRDKRWERVKKAYDLLVHAAGNEVQDAHSAIRASYEAEITDEFMEPVVIRPDHTGFKGIQEGDVVICFNFRTDRCREITEVLTQMEMPEYGMRTMPLYFVTMTNYDASYKNIHVVYDKDNLNWTLGEAIADAGGTQLRIAETEKYPHVTFFFSGGREKPFDGENRIMIPSPKVATYDLMPEMSAEGIAEAAIQYMKQSGPDFFVLNFANPDMVGHTGVYEAIIKAVETTDTCLEKVVQVGTSLGYQFIVIADHGNADFAINEDGSPNTAHTTNPVPMWVVSDQKLELRAGVLADVAPTILELMQIKKPDPMTGHSLIVQKS
jgi:2,3-bisphosphoglycerate-independent phosphoglycerate mutase